MWMSWCILTTCCSLQPWSWFMMISQYQYTVTSSVRSASAPLFPTLVWRPSRSCFRLSPSLCSSFGQLGVLVSLMTSMTRPLLLSSPGKDQHFLIVFMYFLPFCRSFSYGVYFFYWSQSYYSPLIIGALIISILANARNIPNKNILKKKENWKIINFLVFLPINPRETCKN